MKLDNPNQYKPHKENYTSDVEFRCPYSPMGSMKNHHTSDSVSMSRRPTHPRNQDQKAWCVMLNWESLIPKVSQWGWRTQGNINHIKEAYTSNVGFRGTMTIWFTFVMIQITNLSTVAKNPMKFNCIFRHCTMWYQWSSRLIIDSPTDEIRDSIFLFEWKRKITFSFIWPFSLFCLNGYSFYNLWYNGTRRSLYSDLHCNVRLTSKLIQKHILTMSNCVWISSCS